MQETWVRSLGREDPQKRKWLPIPVFLPGEFHGQRSLAGYSPWGRKKLDTTEWLTQQQQRPDFDLLFLIVAQLLCRKKEKSSSKLKEHNPEFIRMVFEVWDLLSEAWEAAVACVLFVLFRNDVAGDGWPVTCFWVDSDGTNRLPERSSFGEHGLWVGRGPGPSLARPP